MPEPDSLTSPDVLTVAARFNGPPGSGNGGYVAGLLAARAPEGVATVTLRQPPPLDRALKVAAEPGGGVGLYDGELLVAEAGAELPYEVPNGPELFEPIDPVSFELAQESSAAFFGGRAQHPYPTCFVCGTERAEGDGLRLFPGLLPQRPGTTACAWVPDASLTGPDGARVRPEFVWAALDCPGAWTALGADLPVLLLGRFAARVDALPYLGDRCVVMGRLLARVGRKVRTSTTLYDGDGRVAAHAEALWIAPRESA
ncbi:hypothetical protein [Yinghuangia soli]|uniref:Thioesterase family protein n=1 Tax=Yinghuangia soli TaxID=2908204 RepID=A0AA41Q0T2_9ACTN|nr:hypothetical protein [Yinghuangia soli]MCF2529463.1 hypothetical protein [Yinghuangia soli]